MGTWSAAPVGNDAAADFVGDLDGQRRWTVVQKTLAEALTTGVALDSDDAEVVIAAAEVVAHGLGRPTQNDAYTESIEQFVARARRPSGRLTRLALQAVEVAAHEDGELAELWAEDDASEWREAVGRLVASLRAGRA